MQKMKPDMAINSLHSSAVYNRDFFFFFLWSEFSAQIQVLLVSGLELKLKVKYYLGSCGPEVILILQRKRTVLLNMCGLNRP